MKPIGGFFELELPTGNNLFHKNAYPFSTGLACLNFIIQKVKPLTLCHPTHWNNLEHNTTDNG